MCDNNIILYVYLLNDYVQKIKEFKKSNDKFKIEYLYRDNIGDKNNYEYMISLYMISIGNLSFIEKNQQRDFQKHSQCQNQNETNSNVLKSDNHFKKCDFGLTLWNWDVCQYHTKEENNIIVEFNNDACRIAAINGHLRILKWLLTLFDFANNSIISSVSSSSSESTDESAKENQKDLIDTTKSKNVNIIENTIKQIKLTKLKTKYIITNFFEIACHNAALGGHIDVLEWLLETIDRQNIKIAYDICQYAIKGNQLETLKWAISINCHFGHEHMYLIIDKEYLHMLEWLCKIYKEYVVNYDELFSIYVKAVDCDKLEVVKWLHNNKMIDTSGASICDLPIRLGRLDILKWLHKKGYKGSIISTSFSNVFPNTNNHFQTLIWLHENNYEINFKKAKKNVKACIHTYEQLFENEKVKHAKAILEWLINTENK